METGPAKNCVNLDNVLHIAWLFALAIGLGLLAATPAQAQNVQFYLSESTFNAALPASRTTVVEDFASVTSNFNAAVQPATPDQWNGFTVVATGGGVTSQGPVRYCASLAGSGCVTTNTQSPSVPGLVVRGQTNSPTVTTIISPSAGTFAVGIDEVDWNNINQYFAMDVRLSNNTTVTYVRPARSQNSPPGFVGMKVSDSLIASGVTITSITFRVQFFDRSFGIFKVQTISAADPLVVTSTADTNTVGTLRFAINHANANAGDDTITFDIPGTGPHTITLGSALPIITDPDVTINGLSQPGSSCGQLSTGTPHDLRIFVNGNGTAQYAFDVRAANVTLSGMAVGNFQEKGFYFFNTSGALVECNYFGVQPDGNTASPLVRGALTGAAQFEIVINGIIRNNLISGNNDDPDDDGLKISNGSSQISILGNVFGLNAAGAASLGNGDEGIEITGSSQITLGGTSAADRNVISGNGGDGLLIDNSSNVTVIGNYIGLNTAGAAAIGNGDDGVEIRSGSSTIFVGNSAPGARNVVSGNGDEGIQIESSSDITILNNYAGLGPDGLSVVPNQGEGILLDNATGVSIGDGTAAGRNVIGGNGARGIWSFQGSTNITIAGNFIGTDASGNVAVANGGNVVVGQRHGIDLGNGTVTNIAISDNVIGGYDRTGIIFFNVTGSGNTITGNSIGVGANGSSDITSATGFNFAGVGIGGTSNGGSVGLTIGGIAPGEGNVIANGGASGINAYFRTGLSVIGNTMRDNAGSGVVMAVGSNGPIYANSIYNNGGIGIDLNNNGVTENDPGDGDSGPNDLLNFPVINTLGANGTADLIYDFNLDAPASANGYRIEFFRNSSADPSGNGEGEVYLGSVNVDHAGGDLNFTGVFTANAPVSVSDIISATATRNTGSGFDITSEFSDNAAASARGALTVEITSEVYDPGAAGFFAVPQNDRLMTATVTNEVGTTTTNDSIFLIIDVPADAEFYNGDVDDAGPETNPVAFDGTNAPGLTFAYLSDVRYSDAGTRPDFASCAYTPAAGYDPNVRFICINPKGAMPQGAPPPSFAVKFRQRIR